MAAARAASMWSQIEHERLAAVIAWPQDAGKLLLPSPSDPGDHLAADGLLDHFRATIGDQIVEAALAADLDQARTRGPLPTAVLPVWPFEAEGDDPDDRDVLLASGRHWGADVLLEALRVADPDNPEPVCEVRSRFDRWVKAVGGGRMRAVIHPPGARVLGERAVSLNQPVTWWSALGQRLAGLRHDTSPHSHSKFVSISSNLVHGQSARLSTGSLPVANALLWHGHLEG